MTTTTTTTTTTDTPDTPAPTLTVDEEIARTIKARDDYQRRLAQALQQEHETTEERSTALAQFAMGGITEEQLSAVETRVADAAAQAEIVKDTLQGFDTHIEKLQQEKAHASQVYSMEVVATYATQAEKDLRAWETALAEFAKTTRALLANYDAARTKAGAMSIGLALVRNTGLPVNMMQTLGRELADVAKVFKDVRKPIGEPDVPTLVKSLPDQMRTALRPRRSGGPATPNVRNAANG